MSWGYVLCPLAPAASHVREEPSLDAAFPAQRIALARNKA
jgi:hypothetical protein